MHCFDDFQPDGYSVFRISDVQSIRCGPYEAHWDAMLSRENLLGGLKVKGRIDLSSMQSAVDSIHRSCACMIVECEDAVEDVEDFYIGTAIRTGPSRVTFEHFDGLGEWAEKSATIKMRDISLIQFRTPYIERFWKYVPKLSRPTRI